MSVRHLSLTLLLIAGLLPGCAESPKGATKQRPQRERDEASGDREAKVDAGGDEPSTSAADDLGALEGDENKKRKKKNCRAGLSMSGTYAVNSESTALRYTLEFKGDRLVETMELSGRSLVYEFDLTESPSTGAWAGLDCIAVAVTGVKKVVDRLSKTWEFKTPYPVFLANIGGGDDYEQLRVARDFGQISVAHRTDYLYNGNSRDESFTLAPRIKLNDVEDGVYTLDFDSGLAREGHQEGFLRQFLVDTIFKVDVEAGSMRSIEQDYPSYFLEDLREVRVELR